MGSVTVRTLIFVRLHRPAVTLVFARLLAVAACIHGFGAFCLADSPSNNYLQGCFCAEFGPVVVCTNKYLGCNGLRYLMFVFVVGCGGLHYHVLAFCLAVSPSNNYLQAYFWAEFCVVSACARIGWPRGGLQ